MRNETRFVRALTAGLATFVVLSGLGAGGVYLLREPPPEEPEPPPHTEGPSLAVVVGVEPGGRATPVEAPPASQDATPATTDQSEDDPPVDDGDTPTLSVDEPLLVDATGEVGDATTEDAAPSDRSIADLPVPEASDDDGVAALEASEAAPERAAVPPPSPPADATPAAAATRRTSLDELVGTSVWDGSVDGRPSTWTLTIAPDGSVRGMVRTRFGDRSIDTRITGTATAVGDEVSLNLSSTDRPHRFLGSVSANQTASGTLTVRERPRGNWTLAAR